MSNLEKKMAITLAMLLVTVIFIPVYGFREPARQQAAADRIKREARYRGAELYTADCAICHGKAGEGGLGTALRQTKLDEAALSRIISRGVVSKGMPAWSEEEGGSLKKHQIQDIVTFMLNWDDSELKQVEAAQATHAPSATLVLSPTPTPTPVPSPLADAIRGRELYSSQGCAACHGADAGGSLGPALKGKEPSLIARVVRNGGKGMPNFSSDRLSDADLNNMIAFLAGLK